MTRTIGRRAVPRALVCVLLFPLAACGEANMTDQDRAKTWDQNEFFDQHMTMREPVAGTVPRSDPAKPAPQPATITPALLDRGAERYGIFCSPCHGNTGAGRGMIVERGFPQPTSLVSERARGESAAALYGAIAQGHRTMFGMAQMIPSADRWAIVAYLRALQLSQDAEVARLPDEDRVKLGAAR